MKISLPSDLKCDTGAVSPLIGVILMLFLTILLAGLTVSTVYGDDISGSLGKAPMAMIEVESIEGGVPNNYGYGENYAVLVHKGGDPLETRSTRMIISGEGSAYIGVVGNGNTYLNGEVLINYDDLTSSGKNSSYASHNPDIQDGVWSAGERLVVNGRDSIVGNAPSSVHVTIKGMTNTSDNYGLRENSIITIKVIDDESGRFIAELDHAVTPAH